MLKKINFLNKNEFFIENEFIIPNRKCINTKMYILLIEIYSRILSTTAIYNVLIFNFITNKFLFITIIEFINFLFLPENLRQSDVQANAVANRNISGIDCWLMIQRMIAKAFLWIGFYSQAAACAGTIFLFIVENLSSSLAKNCPISR